MHTLSCEVCQALFQVKPYRAATARFCSQACGGKWHMANRQMPSAHKVGNKYRQGLRPTNAFTAEQVAGDKNPKWVEPIRLNCSHCQAPFEVKPWLHRQNQSKSGYRFCSDPCRNTFMRGDKDVRYVGGPVTYRGRGWLAARKVAVERDGGTCRECGKVVGPSISVHHIKPYRDFLTPSDANHPDNLICYCQSCHIRLEPPLARQPA